MKISKYKKNTKSKYFTIALVLVSLLFAQCSKESKEGQSVKKAPLVKVTELKPSKIENTMQFPGTFEAKVQSNIIAPIDGIIDDFRLNENDYVVRNQTIAVINSQDRLSLIANANKKVDLAKQKLTSLKESDELYEAAKQELNNALEDLKYSDKLLMPVPVVAPINGMVTRKNIEEGSVVTAKQLLLTIADFKSLVIKTSVSDQLISKIKLGQAIKITIDAYPGKEFTGVITIINPQSDPVTRTILLEIKVSAQGVKLQPGMMAVLTFVSESKPYAIAVPNDAILTKPNGDKFVFVVQDTIAQQRIIETGMSTKDVTEVISGVSAGEKLVTLGQEMLKDKMRVSLPSAKANVPNQPFKKEKDEK